MDVGLVPFWGGVNVLELLGSGDDCTTDYTSMSYLSVNIYFKVLKMVNFKLHDIMKIKEN